MKKVFFIIGLLLNMTFLFSQTLHERDYFFNTISTNGNRINSYYFGGNPAFLYQDDSDQRLSILSSFENTDGEFKRFIDPDEIRKYELSFTGKKILDSIQIFKGSFAFQRLERHQWNWFTSRNYDYGNPFLIGDSTIGRNRYNGILLEAKYAAKIFNNFLFGARFDYAVDEGLKEVAPRPTSDHRDIDATFGLGYLFNNKFNVGAAFRFYDLNEQIKYREDEGAIFQETILFKFRGYSNPFIIRKKVETRYTYQNGYFGGIDFSLIHFYPFNLTGFFSSGFEQAVVKDDANNPQPEGYWKNNIIITGIKGSIDLTKDLKLGFQYNFDDSEMWARHPQFNVLFMESSRIKNGLLLGLEYLLSNKITLLTETAFSITNYKYDDYYSNIFWESTANQWLSRLGIDLFINNEINILAAGEYTSAKIVDNSNSIPNLTSSSAISRINDILFYQTDYDGFRGYLRASIIPYQIGEFIFYLIYSKYSPGNYFAGNRSSIDAALEFRILAY